MSHPQHSGPRSSHEIASPATSDSQLMAQVNAGSVAAFDEIYARFRGRAYGVAFAVCHDGGYAQDAVQEAFVSVWLSRADYRPARGSVAAWLLTGVRYRAIDIARRNARFTAHRVSGDSLPERPAADDVSERVMRQDSAARLQASVGRLPITQQEVIALAYYGELSQAEIADHLGLPSGTVKGRMRLGLQKLRAFDTAA